MPIPTVELSESIFSRLNRVFNSQDSYEYYKFSEEEFSADWEEYRDTKFWRTQGFEAMQTAINSVWVVGLNDTGDDKLEPVNQLINIDAVIDIEVDHENNCKHVLFKDGNLIYVYDEVAISVYQDVEGVISAEPIYYYEHKLGYTPARMFWSEMLGSKDYINKESPITKELSDLDWLLLHKASKKYLDLANAYPILVSYDLDETYINDRLTDGQEKTTLEDSTSMLGPGEHLKVSPPQEGQVDLMSNPVKYIGPDVAALEWHVKEEDRLTQKIFKSVVGADQEQRNDAAKNEMQIESAYESQVSVLMRIKINLEVIHKFADSTICKLRYGKSFVKCHIDYGTKFFLKSEDDLHEDYKKAQESGASEIVLNGINDSIINTRYRDNDSELLRAKIIQDIDPMPNKSVDDIIKIYNAGGMDRESFIIKLNLLSFIKRFERENGSLSMFGENVEYKSRIDSINQKLKDYVNEQQA